jgi:hypothetical protein
MAVPRPQGNPLQQALAIKQQMEHLQGENQQLKQTVERLSVQLQHYIGTLICILRTHPEANRFPLKEMEKVGPDLGINTKRDDVSDEMVLEILTKEEYALQMQGLVQATQTFEVPAKPPFEIQLEIPEGAKLAGIKIVEIIGKEGSRQLKFTGRTPKGNYRKPKGVLEFSCSDDARMTFSTDSQGQKGQVVYVFKLPDEIEEPEVEAPLECQEEWHLRDNDGISIIGVCCPKCGDKRKLIPEAAESR